MSFALQAVLAVAIGVALGLWATQTVVNRGFPFGAITDGPWVAFPTVGSPQIDPYARAVLARSAVLPIGADEGLVFVAVTDSGGRPLRGECAYSIESGELPSRFWSLALFDTSGHVLANAAQRYALTSQDVVRLDKRFAIAIASTIRSGNWLPSPTRGAFTLAFSLYETNSGTALASAADIALPRIERGACGS